jgi:hypothetical protein
MNTDVTQMIATEFAKVIGETMKRFAKEFGCEDKDVQVLLGLKVNDGEADENTYGIMHKYSVKKKVGFTDNGILKQKVDFSGMAQIVPPVINQMLKSIAAENSIPEGECFLMLIKSENGIRFYLYNGTTPVREMSEEEIFSKVQLS